MNRHVLYGVFLMVALSAAPWSAQADTARGVFVSPTTGVSVGTVWGVFVGISQYQDRTLNLRYADRDAHSLYIFFSEHFMGRIPPDHFRLLTNEQATRGKVLQALTETLRLAQPEDLVIISMAMHGLADSAGNDLYFLAHDSDPNYPEDRAISQYDLIKQIQRGKARKIVLALDACHAGGFGASVAFMRGASSAEINRMLVTLGQVQDGIAVLTSSSAAELSQEGEQFCGGHGAFTCWLVEGLKGKADADKNGLVQIRELFDYTYREVKQQTKGAQHPSIEGRYDNGLPLATIATPEEVKQFGAGKKDFKYADYEALKAKAEYQSKLEKAWQAVDGIARMDELPSESRITALNQFLQDFPEENRHRTEASGMVEQIQQDAKQKQLDLQRQQELVRERKQEQQRQLELAQAKAAQQAKMEQAWLGAQGSALVGAADSQTRIADLNRFLQEYPEDNPHRTEAQKLVEQIQQDMKQKQLEEQRRLELQRQQEQQRQLELAQAKAAQQAKMEQAWASAQGGAQGGSADPQNRISSLNRFLQEYPEDNPHRAEANRLVSQLQQEAKEQELERQRQLELARQLEQQRLAEQQRKLEEQRQLQLAQEKKQKELEQQRQQEEQRRLEQQRQERLAQEKKQKELEQQKQLEDQRRLEQQKQLEREKPVGVARAPAYDAGKDWEAKLEREIMGVDGVPMVLVPSGEFTMGNSAVTNERPAHRVYLDAYYVDVFEVTNARYAKFLEASAGKQALPIQWKMMNPVDDGERPVIGVSWSDADAYCRWAEKRLPTEAEWEKAARGSDERKYPWGNADPTEELANFGRCCGWSGYSLLAAVGSHTGGKSPYGVHDLAGNVWEWVSDWYDPQYYKLSPDKNPTGPSSGHDKVMRGGSWSNRASELRTTVRDKVAPTYRNYSVGFRCAADVRK